MRDRETFYQGLEVNLKSQKISFSKICTALLAAPFRKLSATTHKLTPEGTLKSLRILPTKVAS